MVLRHGWVPDRLCVWQGVLKLPPGTTLSVRADELGNCDTEQLRGKIRTWWSLAEVAEAGQKNLITSSLPEVEAELDQLLRTVVRERMVADVPLGAFLSGGIDSTTIVALMQAQSSRPVRTFTIGFRETSYDETDHASRVARHFGTHHTEFCLTPTETLAVIPELPKVWDEPFADESQIPTLLLSRLARQHVTVALSGDGGDECFGGYARYFMSARLGSILGLPPMARRMAASALLMLRPGTWDEILRALPLPRGMRPTLRGENLQKCARVLEMADEDHLYEMLTSLGGAPMAADPGEPERYEVPSLPDTVSRLIYRDMASYLPGDILVKLDRATMAASLEARSPFLDHRVVEYSWKLPTALKINDGQGKWLLRRVLQRYLPEDLFERPKQGFNVPIGAWLIGPLREWAQELVDSSRIRREGLLDCNRVQSCWQEHLSGRSDRARELWAVLMVQAWLDEARTLRPPSTPTGRIEAQMEAAGAPASRVSEHIAYG
jgi:asparagine synthase (glutamine-hydrolysing)